jgi:DNA-directed RNA polymerase specialized sigma24 family protein
MNERELSWPELLARLQAGPSDGPAWQDAWQEAWHRLEAYARGVLRSGRGDDSAEDVVQQVLLKLLAPPDGLGRQKLAQHPEEY